MKRAIVWFNTDLRLRDNETLISAIEHNDEIIPVYCLQDSHFITTDFGFKKTGSFRAQFLLDSLINLDKNLREIGSGLIVTIGNPSDKIIELVKKYGVHKVYSKKEVSYEEIQIQEQLEKELWKVNCELQTFSTSTLYHPKDLPFSLKFIPDVFTSFRKQVEKECNIRDEFTSPLQIKSPYIEPINLPTLEELDLQKATIDERAAIAFKGGEKEALERLNYYLYQTKAISTYKETRNELIGEKYSSKFSAWLSLGCISARTIYQEIKRYEAKFGANDSTYWLVFELMWRDYFRFMMKKYRNQFFLRHGIKGSKKEEKKHDKVVFEKWKNGDTGNDFIDANMIELKLTGFMSNRGRQNVASYLCHNLNLDWRYGAAYFEEQLIDYDASSNWGNWAYIAGVGNDPREARVFNIEKQANDYDKNKNYRKLWLSKI